MADVRGVSTANLHGTSRGDEAVTDITAATARRIDAKSSSCNEIDADGDDGRRRTTTRAAISAGIPTLQWASRDTEEPQSEAPEAVTEEPAVAANSGARGTRAWMNAPNSDGAHDRKHWRSQRTSVADSDERKAPLRGRHIRRAKTPACQYFSRRGRAAGSGGAAPRADSNAAFDARRAAHRSRRNAIVTCLAHGHTVEACTRTPRRAAASRGKKRHAPGTDQVQLLQEGFHLRER